jgi:glycine/D-amino acid oxidase-like deaminating enzyme
MIGGRGDLTGRREDPASYHRLERTLRRLFPALADIRIEHRWRGMVAVTLDALPHLGSLGPRIHYGLGYGGRGLVLAHAVGAMLARRALGEPIDPGPLGEAGFGPIPLHRWRRPLMQLAAGYWSLLDRREERMR